MLDLDKPLQTGDNGKVRFIGRTVDNDLIFGVIKQNYNGGRETVIVTDHNGVKYDGGNPYNWHVINVPVPDQTWFVVIKDLDADRPEPTKAFSVRQEYSRLNWGQIKIVIDGATKQIKSVGIA